MALCCTPDFGRVNTKSGRKFVVIEVAKQFKSRKEFAKCIGVTERTVYKWVSGVMNPSNRHYVLILEVARIDS